MLWILSPEHINLPTISKWEPILHMSLFLFNQYQKCHNGMLSNQYEQVRKIQLRCGRNLFFSMMEKYFLTKTHPRFLEIAYYILVIVYFTKSIMNLILHNIGKNLQYITINVLPNTRQGLPLLCVSLCVCLRNEIEIVHVGS